MRRVLLAVVGLTLALSAPTLANTPAESDFINGVLPKLQSIADAATAGDVEAMAAAGADLYAYDLAHLPEPCWAQVWADTFGSAVVTQSMNKAEYLNVPGLAAAGTLFSDDIDSAIAAASASCP